MYPFKNEFYPDNNKLNAITVLLQQQIQCHYSIITTTNSMPLQYYYNNKFKEKYLVAVTKQFILSMQLGVGPLKTTFCPYYYAY